MYIEYGKIFFNKVSNVGTLNTTVFFVRVIGLISNKHIRLELIKPFGKQLWKSIEIASNTSVGKN